MSVTKYTPDHEWVRVEGDTATVGITHHAQNALGDVVFVELPAVGRSFKAGDVAGVVESVKAAADIFTPLTGAIVEVNAALVAEPALANSDPLRAGWFFKVAIANPAEVEALLDHVAYTALTGS